MNFLKKGLLWIPRGSASGDGNVAPRPHWAALIAAYIGPIFSAAALLVSLKSFQVAERALQVNMATTQILNQSQLVIENGYLHFGSLSPRPDDTQKALTVGYILENTGNSFAEIKALTFSAEFPRRFGGYQFTNEYDKTLIIPAKVKLEKKFVLSVSPDFPFDPNGPIINKRIGIKVTAKLIYTDVFGDKEKHWCWGVSLYDIAFSCEDIILDY